MNTEGKENNHFGHILSFQLSSVADKKVFE